MCLSARSHTDLESSKGSATAAPQQTGTTAVSRSKAYTAAAAASNNTSNTTINTSCSNDNTLQYRPIANEIVNRHNHEIAQFRAASAVCKSPYDRSTSSLPPIGNVSGCVASGIATINPGMNRGPSRYQVPNSSPEYCGSSGSSNAAFSLGVPGGRGRKVPPKVPPKPSSATKSPAPHEYANPKVRSGLCGRGCEECHGQLSNIKLVSHVPSGFARPPFYVPLESKFYFLGMSILNAWTI